ncbi:MAG: hypothetical protein EHM63_00965 [Actinobacteria bacterium]|nr:MAG: hypothetical protein EHM63_00965 [Actinomycetota bacterium]
MLGLAVVFALAGVAVVVFSGDDEGVSHPDDWDPRVVELVDFVQDERGLLFEHPVRIDFLTAEEYTARILERDELTDEDVEELEQAEAELRAMGLVTGDVDLVEALRTVRDEGTLAYYDQEEDRIIIRGTEISPALSVTLVHELTHALQAQHFDLEREEEGEDGADDVFRSLVEGDATRIEEGYVASLSDDELAAYEDETESQEESADLSAVPSVWLAFVGAPYSLGRDLVTYLAATDGNGAVNDALDDPPRSELVLLDPFRYSEDESVADVPVPALSDGESQLDDGDLGALTLFFLLSSQHDALVALEAADGWGGDAYVTFERDDRVCMRVSVAGVDDRAASELENLLQEWGDASPAAGVEVTRDARTVTFVSCDPGSENDAPELDFAGEIMAVPLARAEIGVEFMTQGAPPGVARCISGKIVGAYSVEDLYSADPAQFQTQEFFDQVRGFAETCDAEG